MFKNSLYFIKFLDFSDEEINLMKKLKRDRIDAQYYTDRKVIIKDIDKIKDFVLKCKKLFQESDFNGIRQEIKKVI